MWSYHQKVLLVRGAFFIFILNGTKSRLAIEVVGSESKIKANDIMICPISLSVPAQLSDAPISLEIWHAASSTILYVLSHRCWQSAGAKWLGHGDC